MSLIKEIGSTISSLLRLETKGKLNLFKKLEHFKDNTNLRE